MVAVGEKVFGKYEVIRRLAVGGMGEIFLARQTGIIDRLVILKNLLPQLASDTASVTSFLDEARILGSINHPNVVGLYDVGEWDGTHFHAMEYINGVDISHVLKTCEEKTKRVPPLVSAQIVREAALGLDAAHVATDATGQPLRIVHRDISPHNLMVRADGVCKVVDFGVAVAENRHQKTEGTGLLKGKLGYMPPEQIKGAPVEPKADQFSLGVLFWEMLTQRRLFVGENAAQIFTKIIKETIPPPSTVQSDVPPELDAIVLRMTAQEPVTRYARLGDAAIAIRKALEQHKHPDNGSSQFVRTMFGPELQARLKELASSSPPKPASATGPTPSPSPRAPGGAVFCGACGTQAQPGDRFCRTCGKPVAAVIATSTPNLTPSPVTATGGRTPAAATAVPRSDPSATAVVPRVDVLGPATGSRSGVIGVGSLLPTSARTPTSTRVPALAPGPPGGATGPSNNPGELAIVVGLVEQMQGGALFPADPGALRATTAALEMYAQQHGGIFEGGDGPRFALMFAGDGAAKAAVAVARANVRITAHIGNDVLLRLGVAADGGSGSELAARLRSVAEQLAGSAAPGLSVIADNARSRAGDVATNRSANVPLREGGSVLAHEVALPRRLAGRSVDLAALDSLLDEVARESHALQLMLLGEGGIGKTALVESAVLFARDRGFIIGAARGARVTRPPAFDVLRQVIRSACVDALTRERMTGGWSRALEFIGLSAPTAARLRALVDDDGPGFDDVPVHRRRAVLNAAVLQLFEKLTERAPVLVALDDFERSDPNSMHLLAELGARLGERRLAILAAGRPVQGERTLPLARRVVLNGLAPADIVAVGTLLLGAPVGGALGTLLVQRAQGFPLVVALVLRHLLAVRALSVGPGGAVLHVDPERAGLAPNALQLLLSSHQLLPPDAQTVLIAAAAVGQIIEPGQLARVAEGVRDITGALRRLTDAGIMESLADERWAFRSNVEFEAITPPLDPARVRRLHGRLAEALSQELVSRFRIDLGERIIVHLQAIDALDAAAETAERVAQRATSLGLFELAAEHLRRAFHQEWRSVGNARLDEEKARRILRIAALATAALTEVDASAAVDLAGPALAQVPVGSATRARVEAQRQRGLALARLKRFDHAEQALEDALSALAGEYDELVAAGLLVDLATLLEQRGDVDGSLTQLKDALRLFASARNADPYANQERAFDAILLYARLQLRQNQPATAREAVVHALDGIRAERRFVIEAEARAVLAAVALIEGAVETSVRECEAALAAAAVVDDPQLEARLQQQLGRAFVALGRRADARTAFLRALECATRGQWDEGVSATRQLLGALG
jgi:serine/threonine protein kinase/tetratricopeptide (TPR) repeat protein